MQARTILLLSTKYFCHKTIARGVHHIKRQEFIASTEAISI